MLAFGQCRSAARHRVLEVSAPRGNFTLRQGDGPVLLSAGIGSTGYLRCYMHWPPRLRHARSDGSTAPATGGEHPFAAETRALLEALPRAHSHVCYSAPGLADRAEVRFNTSGRLDLRMLQELGVPRDANFYLCGPTAFMSDLTAALEAWGVATHRIHTEIFG